MSIYKQAGGGADAVLGQMMPLSGVGGLLGALSKTPDKREIQDYNEGGVMSLIPGVAGYRYIQRQKAAMPEAGTDRIVVDSVGSVLTAPLLLAAAGGVIGTLYGRHKGATGKALMLRTLKGVVHGGAAGMGMNILGTLAGAARAKRTAEEQAEAEEAHSNLAALTVPGYGTYQMARRAKSTNS